MALIRLQKFLSLAGVCSRRKAEEHILAGRISVNRKLITTLGTKIDPDKDLVCFDGKKIEYKQNLVYIALNKPMGYVSSCRHQGKKIVLDLIKIDTRVYPIGRLDEYSTGLILLTNDGRLHHHLSHPSFDHEKEYLVTVQNPLTNQDLQRMSQGIVISGRKTRSANVKRLSQNRFRIVLKEGRNRQIRRMVDVLGNKVLELKRVRVAKIRLGKLPTGSWRYLTDTEIKSLIDPLVASLSKQMPKHHLEP